MAGYDIHHICDAINECNPKNKFSVIPTTDEKYISFTFSVWVNSYIDKNGVTKMYMKTCDSWTLLNSCPSH